MTTTELKYTVTINIPPKDRQTTRGINNLIMNELNKLAISIPYETEVIRVTKL